MFSAIVDDSNKDLHLELASHLYPQLVNRSGQLRYSKASPSELIIAKRHYKIYLSVIPRDTPTIPDHIHRAQIESHEVNLAHPAEMMRQELVATGTLFSNYADQACKAFVVLEALCACLIEVLGANQIQAKEVTVKKEPVDEDGASDVKDGGGTMDIEEEVGAKGDDKHMRGTGDEGFAVTGSDTESRVEPAPPGVFGPSEAHVPQTLPPATLPEILITEAIGGHLCKCKACSPTLAQTVTPS